jgi:hypothetical protein
MRQSRVFLPPPTTPWNCLVKTRYTIDQLDDATRLSARGNTLRNCLFLFLYYTHSTKRLFAAIPFALRRNAGISWKTQSWFSGNIVAICDSRATERHKANWSVFCIPQRELITQAHRTREPFKCPDVATVIYGADNENICSARRHSAGGEFRIGNFWYGARVSRRQIRGSRIK